jgi:hypothetical protein
VAILGFKGSREMDANQITGAVKVIADKDTLAYYAQLIQRKAPEYFDLFTAGTEREFEDAFTALLQEAVAHLERNSVNFKSLGEVPLTAVIVAFLNVPGLKVTQEAHSNGHVDITIFADHCVPARRKLGEAKIYSSPSYHEKGIKQLVGRYSTGREIRGLLLNYVRKADIAEVITNLRDSLDKKLPEKQKGATQDHKLKWSFSSVHEHSSGEDLAVDHVGCNLYVK